MMKKILGIGNALVDVIIFLKNDDVLQKFELPRGSMQLVDADTALRIEKATGDCKTHMSSGGSAANTIHGLAGLGLTTGFIGTVGKDEPGDFFREDMKRQGIMPLLTESDSITGSSRALVSPDGERTMATFLGAAVELSANLLNPNIFSGYDHLHIEGYLVLNNELVEKALFYARNKGMTVSLDLASYNVVEANLDFLKKIIPGSIQVVFANEDEARAFTGEDDPHKALEAIAGLCQTAVVKIGERGSLISHQGKKYEAGIIPVKCIDTTGAGDLYASGYLYGMARDMSPQECGKLGALLAGKVIEEAGAKISDSSWEYIRGLVNNEQ
jgi:sugar/nucleoside kinase (ribokinase family)